MAMRPEASTPALYTAAEAAAILRVKASWLERQAAARNIPFTMLGRSYRFTPAHLAVIVRLYEHEPSRGRDPAVQPTRRGGVQPPAATAGQGQPLLPRPRRGPGRGISSESAA
jgi:excisionase family DNA binding protein